MAPKPGVSVRGWLTLGTRFMPFADVATADMPLSRLLRLSLFQLSVGMVQTLFVGTLNRVMILELRVPASLAGYSRGTVRGTTRRLKPLTLRRRARPYRRML